MRKPLATFFAAFFAFAAAAQQQPQPQPKQQPKATDQAPAPYVEKLDVRVINVDVIVTDRKGNRVTGLTKDDFEIYQNGIPKPISNFYEVITEKKPAPAPAVAGAPAP